VHVEVGRAPPEQRVPVSEVVVDLPESIAAMRLRALVHAHELGHGVAEGPGDGRPGLLSAACAMVLCSTRAPTGCRSAW